MLSDEDMAEISEKADRLRIQRLMERVSQLEHAVELLQTQPCDHEWSVPANPGLARRCRKCRTTHPDDYACPADLLYYPPQPPQSNLKPHTVPAPEWRTMIDNCFGFAHIYRGDPLAVLLDLLTTLQTEPTTVTAAQLAAFCVEMAGPEGPLLQTHEVSERVQVRWMLSGFNYGSDDVPWEKIGRWAATWVKQDLEWGPREKQG